MEQTKTFGAGLRAHLDCNGLELAMGRPGFVFVRSAVPFTIGQASHCAGFSHRVQAGAFLRLWPIGCRAGEVLVYR